jgi:hypothetical protein
MRVAAILLGLWGVQTLMYGYWYGFTVLPSPLDVPAVSLVAGIAAITSAVGILRTEAWARALGLVVMAVWALELLVAIAPSVEPAVDLASNVPAVVSWAIGLILFGFVGRELLARWPDARPRDRSGSRRTFVLLAIVLVPLVVLAAAVRPAEPGPFEPLPPLGPEREGGRLELATTGLAVELPADWTVEVASPERDPVGAPPGEAWEALRAFGPSGRQTCSVSVAVSPSATTRDGYDVGSMSGDDRAPRWSGPVDRPTLMLPDSSDRVEPPGGPHASQISTQVRRAGSAGEHDILYAIECGSGAGSSLGGIAESLTILPLQPSIRT